MCFGGDREKKQKKVQDLIDWLLEIKEEIKLMYGDFKDKYLIEDFIMYINTFVVFGIVSVMFIIVSPGVLLLYNVFDNK